MKKNKNKVNVLGYAKVGNQVFLLTGKKFSQRKEVKV